MSSDRWRSGGVFEAAILAAIGIAVVWDSFSYPKPLVDGAPGPAFMPRLLAGLLLGCAVVLAVRALSDREREVEVEPVGVMRLFGAVGSVAVFLLLSRLLDVFLLLPLLVVALMLLAGERSKPALVFAPLGFTLFVYAVFVRALGVALPTRLG